MGPRPRVLVAIFLSTVLASGPLAHAAPDADQTPAPRPSFLSRHRRALLIAAGGGAAACGIGAIVSRSAANSRYDEYQRTADPERIQALYRETEDLDNRAAVLFVTSEALFLATLYLGFFVAPAEEDQGFTADSSDQAADASRPEAAGQPLPELVPTRGGLAVQWRF